MIPEGTEIRWNLNPVIGAQRPLRILIPNHAKTHLYIVSREYYWFLRLRPAPVITPELEEFLIALCYAKYGDRIKE